ncbi:hypothetical protein LL972_21480 [Xanthomonas campestris pv. asclepiadis]|uniref:hypothetical protein n=1 Tax=Xanthomonas campestris TaxID=339 RepID=UPI001E3BC20E|nr:hypothetical protein [Xanthomonas campestris]MCC4618519.1 hypothetical protein [Xanthomonas campestris pv. asclepiadis]
MSTFEWIVVVLLVLILFKPHGKPFRLEGTTLSLMQQYESRLIAIETYLAEIDASTRSASDDIAAMRIAQLPDYPPDGP